jgi:N-methylhydantoinase B
MYAADGTINPALGARGGEPGALARPMMRRADGEVMALEAWGHVVLEPGETIISISAAGGGYGSPTDRDPERVRHDVEEGWVSAARAGDAYGVVLAEDGSVDEAGTAERRRRLEEGEARPDGPGDDAALSLVDSNTPPGAGGARPAG